MVSVKVLGTGCPNCQKLEATAYAAVAGLDVDAKVEKISDVSQIMSYGLISMPGLVIDEEIMASGRIPSEKEIKTWVLEAAQAS